MYFNRILVTDEVFASAVSPSMKFAMAVDSRQNEVLVVAAFFFFLSWITVSLRFYVRGKLMHTWGADDT
jgi:hypothetical protein